MKVLLTGATGFLGSHICEQLVDAGHEVRALVRKTSDTRVLQTLRSVELFEGAIEDRTSCLRACEGIDAIIHNAALVKARSEAEFRLANVIGTQNMLDGATLHKKSIKRFVFVSSLAARAPSTDGRPLPDSAEPAPVTTYGRTKLEAERAVLACKDDFHVVVVRPTAIYGARDREMFQLFQVAHRRVAPLVGDPRGKLTLIHGEDCARAIVLTLDAQVPSGRAYDLDDGRVYNRQDLVRGLELAVGQPALVHLPIPRLLMETVGLVSEQVGRVTNRSVMLTREKVNELHQQWVGNSKPAQEELGFRPRLTWEDGAKKTADWYFSNGWL